jgi:hypothetical protein
MQRTHPQFPPLHGTQTLEIAESTWNRWRNQYGGMKADGAKWLRELEAELDKAMLKELAEGKW